MLIATEPDDPHADMVVAALGERDVPVFRFHPEEFPIEVAISIEHSGTRWSAEIRGPKRSVRLEDVRSAWLRRPRPPSACRLTRPMQFGVSRSAPMQEGLRACIAGGT